MRVESGKSITICSVDVSVSVEKFKFMFSKCCPRIPMIFPHQGITKYWKLCECRRRNCGRLDTSLPFLTILNIHEWTKKDLQSFYENWLKMSKQIN